ncbi:MAG TPA: aminopeptidase P family protein [Terriglobales bacterium]|nr:aminopeptidase P family protein [Terriglobales bacterium]
MDYRARQLALRARLASAGLDGLLVAHLPNIRYLTGFSGSNALLLLELGRATLYTDGRYRQQAAQEVAQARVAIPPQGNLWKAAATQAAKLRRLGYEDDRVTVAQRARFLAAWPGKAAALRPASGWTEALRLLKQPPEVAALRRAVALAASVFAPTVAAIQPGMTETALAGQLEFGLRQAGGEGLAFDTIIASGPRGAHVHGRPSAARLPRRGFVVMDYGVKLGGYLSDMTRTVHLGRPSVRARAVYHAVREAQAAALAAVRPGVPASAVDAAARHSLRRAGFGAYFPHSTGHGVGLEIHEAPRLAATSSDLLAAGQVITLEPGVYIPGWGGVRIEDMVLVTAGGAEVLTPTPKDLLSL